MDTKHPLIFLLEDCPITALLIERVVLHEMPDVRILWARDVKEAVVRAEGLFIDLFLVDIILPDGNGFDFLWKMAVEQPSARAIVMTATPLPEHQAHTAALGVLDFVEKPIQFDRLVALLRAGLGRSANDEENKDFHVTLKNVTAADILQLKCLARATTIVEFLSGEHVGRIRFEDGEITDASSGTLQGVDAVYEILGWTRGHVSEHPCVGFPKRTINQPWHSLLMDAAQRLDERSPAAA